MDRELLIKIGLTYNGAELRFPFEPDIPVLYVRNKIFALFHNHNSISSVNLKCNPDDNWIQRETYLGCVIPGWHMNKQHWNTILLNNKVPNKVIEDMLEESYILVASKFSKKVRETLGLSNSKAIT